MKTYLRTNQKHFLLAFIFSGPRYDKCILKKVLSNVLLEQRVLQTGFLTPGSLVINSVSKHDRKETPKIPYGGAEHVINM